MRQHPVTGEKALYVNQGFTKKIVGFKVEESEYLLKFLFDHIAKGSDFQVRGNYKPGTVVVWVSAKNFHNESQVKLLTVYYCGKQDNRVTVHSGTDDYNVSVDRRHAVRLTPQAEIPIPA